MLFIIKILIKLNHLLASEKKNIFNFQRFYV